MIIPNEEITGLTVEIPEGHRHLRATISLKDGSHFTLHEATVANLVRAYVTVKTHPTLSRITMEGRKIAEKKRGYADWQLLED